jgi:hypothetical protein
LEKNKCRKDSKIKWQELKILRKTSKSACRATVRLVQATLKAPEKGCTAPEDRASRSLKSEAVIALNVLFGWITDCRACTTVSSRIKAERPVVLVIVRSAERASADVAHTFLPKSDYLQDIFLKGALNERNK